jgi:hypothetical protein
MPSTDTDTDYTRPADPGAAEHSVAWVHATDVTPPEIRLLQFAELARVAAKYGFDPTPNEFPTDEPEPEPAEVALLRHLGHLTLAGSVLDPAYKPQPRLDELGAIDGVRLHVMVQDRYSALERCILCRGPKGETYTICAGCYTTQLRFAECRMLANHPGMEEGSLAGLKPLEHHQYVRAIRRTPRLAPTLRAHLDGSAEAARRKLRSSALLAHRAAVLADLRDAAESANLTDSMREWLWRRFIHAVEHALPWKCAAWQKGVGALSLDSYWYGLLSSAEMDGDGRDDEDDYPLEWNPEDFLYAPDRVDFVDELHGVFIPRPNAAAGTDEHFQAVERNRLIDALREAESRAAAFGDFESIVYAEFLQTALRDAGGLPRTVYSRTPQERDADEGERWDRWLDSILGGEPAPPPDGLNPEDAEWCRRWALAATAENATTPGTPGQRCPIRLPALDSGLPAGRLRWEHFVQAEIESEFQPWGRWAEIEEDEGRIVRYWCGEETTGTRRQLSRRARTAIMTRRLTGWAKGEARNAVVGPPGRRPKGSRRAWEREIRIERRRRRFEALAEANAGIHPTRLESARHQAI